MANVNFISNVEQLRVMKEFLRYQDDWIRRNPGANPLASANSFKAYASTPAFATDVVARGFNLGGRSAGEMQSLLVGAGIDYTANPIEVDRLFTEYKTILSSKVAQKNTELSAINSKHIKVKYSVNGKEKEATYNLSGLRTQYAALNTERRDATRKARNLTWARWALIGVSVFAGLSFVPAALAAASVASTFASLAGALAVPALAIFGAKKAYDYMGVRRNHHSEIAQSPERTEFMETLDDNIRVMETEQTLKANERNSAQSDLNSCNNSRNYDSTTVIPKTKIEEQVEAEAAAASSRGVIGTLVSEAETFANQAETYFNSADSAVRSIRDAKNDMDFEAAEVISDIDGFAPENKNTVAYRLLCYRYEGCPKRYRQRFKRSRGFTEACRCRKNCC